ncbi:Hpt domain-containing protein [Flammeovirga kamogawensis]|uniref:Hpt domain-containing protein n=1 Tax=Flammeovirga kamogawensis TaxID=373891 RepID=A0ABX8GY59_9BACT|nr:Hpt domain-containing protein [Flammeovirga kamogawensis]MBB6460789.1 HPt (histidine-containing phosphotransfer) domain-containing protein [Flammeovirga kamogawensis]QWG08142.1 Hpt domain-containing protein [Flammeovirga kamogawensis]TRX69945.1 Hpt domain-containing protein [Flammeovirga kamogawensis]
MSTPQNNKMYDLSQLEILSRGDDSFITKMLDSFNSTLKEGIAGINEAKKYNDWENLSKQVHKLKPSMQILGVNSLKDLIASLENDYKTENFNENNLMEKTDAFLENCRTLLIQTQQILHK